ncbi:MAG: hypothetical protein IPQ07_24030 [Myxococcales bacterium]|nr:hypothetical protein [Myxococcales bacterium]
MKYAWFALLAAGCYHPSPLAGAPCAQGDVCPDPLICDRGVCVVERSDAGETPPDVAIDADQSCMCSGDTLTCGGASPVTCMLGCQTLSVGARCMEVDASNDVGITAAETLTSDVSVASGVSTFNTESGRISGALSRSSGQGVLDGIAFELRMTGTTPLGVWTFHRLTVMAPATLQFTGTRSAVFVVGTTVTIAGTISGPGGCSNQASCAGPGAGTGGSMIAATGCGAGGPGVADADVNDGGGGGGGGRGMGGVGGLGGSTLALGGASGAACIAPTLEPLVGGSGGGAGGPGVVTRCRGGGGGGALQITALEGISVSGTIRMTGAGGEGGRPDPAAVNGGAGCGGGGGGGILLEAPQVTLTATAALSVNGGGGGGGASYDVAGFAGADGTLTTTPAAGGLGGGTTAGAGGAGAAGTSAASAGVSNANGGGGGGAAGAIYVRTVANGFTTGGVVTPAAGTGALRTR